MTDERVARKRIYFSSAFVLLAAVFILGAPTVSLAMFSENRVVGRVFDESIYQAELSGDGVMGTAAALHERIVAPVLARYRERYRQLFEPRSYELTAAMTHLQEVHERRLSDSAMTLSSTLALLETQLAQTDLTDEAIQTLEYHRDAVLAELEPPTVAYVWSLVTYWKFQRHLYDAYGGGRVIIQSYGPEAVDATLRWLQLREMEGDFSIEGDALRDAFYELWSQGISDLPEETALSDADRRALDRQYDQNRYRLLNPGWMRSWIDDGIDLDGARHSVTLTTDFLGN